MPVTPRPELKQIKIAVHGGVSFAEFEKRGINPLDVIDFSVSSNPCGKLPNLNKIFSRVDITEYPDSEALVLRRKIASANHLSLENVITGNGSAEIIWLIALAYVNKGDRVLIIEPTFGEYEVAAKIMGAELVSYRVSEGNGFRPEIDVLKHLIEKAKPHVIFICNPNNPTGQYLTKQEIEEIAGASPSTLVVIDEAYVAFVDDPWDATSLVEGGNVLLLRSMTKDYALAGLRIGYALASPEIVENLRKVRPPWNVNSYAQAAAIHALENENFVPKCTAMVWKAKNYLIRSFESLGLPCVPSRANFFIVKVGDAKKTREELLNKGILVRDCTSFGLPQYIRIAPRTLPECRKLVAAMKEIL